MDRIIRIIDVPINELDPCDVYMCYDIKVPWIKQILVRIVNIMDVPADEL